VGLFDFLKKGKGEAEDGKPVDRKLASLSKTASDKRAQSYDRDEALRALIKMGTPEAAEALLKRFTVKVDPSITDTDEKQLVFEGLVSIGKGERKSSEGGKGAKSPPTPEDREGLRVAVVDRARAFCKRAENLTWALKVLRELLDDTAYEGEILSLLSAFDTEYTRNIEPKINLLAAMEDIKSAAVRSAAEGYLDDVNETVRFHAVQTLFAQGDRASMPALIAMLSKEESARIKNKVADGMMKLGWVAPSELREEFRRAMHSAYEYRVRPDGGVERAG
jgi:HEAT repeat protein